MKIFLSSSGGLVCILRGSVSGVERIANEDGFRTDPYVGRHGGMLEVDRVEGMSDRIEKI